tara:strand:+ start:12828 stop:13583 length:756 start_codon:yes stop_codon:yes gene_type:complete
LYLEEKLQYYTMDLEISHAALKELVVANRILANEGVVDAFGHVSVRHPKNPERYIMACSRSPGIVTIADLMEYTLDGDPIDQQGRSMYAERHIHGGIYEVRSDLHSVIHSHSHAVIPFGLTGAEIRPVFHMGSTMLGPIPIWDISDKFGDTTLLVLNMEQGRDLARGLKHGQIALMRGHGCVVGAETIKKAVMMAVYLEDNAKLQMQAMQMGQPRYMTAEEIRLCSERIGGDLAIDRAWEYWSIRAGYSDI